VRGNDREHEQAQPTRQARSDEVNENARPTPETDERTTPTRNTNKRSERSYTYGPAPPAAMFDPTGHRTRSKNNKYIYNIFCTLLMSSHEHLGHQITQEDVAFLRWLDSEENEKFWVKNESGEKVMLREGWDKAQEEYKRIKQLADNKMIFYSEEFRGLKD